MSEKAKQLKEKASTVYPNASKAIKEFGRAINKLRKIRPELFDRRGMLK